MSTDCDPPAHTSPRQALLGIFILLQLAFLIGTNLLGFFKGLPDQLKDKPKAVFNQAAPGLADENSHAGNWLGQIERNSKRWIQLTGQYQDWALYTSVSRGTGFPAVALWFEPATWEPSFSKEHLAYDPKNGFNLIAPWQPTPEAPEGKPSDRRVKFLLSENEPTSLDSYIRFGKCRVRRYEGQFYLNLQPYEDESEIALAERNSRQVSQFLGTWRESVLAYLRWRTRTWRDANPDQPMPQQIMLFQRFYRIHGPEDRKKDDEGNFLTDEDVPRGWDGPILWPIARYRPMGDDLDVGALETFDFTEQRFLLR